MVSSIVALARNLGMSVVAEGVETLHQLSAVRGVGCDYAQGYHFSAPVDAAAATRLIAVQPWRWQHSYAVTPSPTVVVPAPLG